MVLIQAAVNLFECAIYPVVVTGIWNKRKFELEFRAEYFPVCRTIGIDEVTRIGHLQAVSSQQPLVDLHLSLVARMPIFIERVNRVVLGGSLIVDDNIVTPRLLPEIGDRTRYDEVGVLVKMLYANEIFSPGFEIFVRDRSCLDAVGLEQWMLCVMSSMDIELLFQ